MENIIFGIRPIAEAIEAHKQIERIYVKKGADGQLMNDLKDLMARHHLRWQEVPIEKLNRLTRGNHQGVVAVAAIKEYCEIEDIIEYARQKDEKPFVIIADGINDPHNLGAIIRSAECAGVHGIIIPKRDRKSVV